MGFFLRRSAALIVFITLAGIQEATAFELSVVGATNFANPAIDVGGVTATGYNAKPAFGGGVLVGFSMLPALEWEIGALYVGRHYKYPTSNGQAEDSYYSYEVPLIFRLTALQYINIGAGAYVAVPSGEDTYTLTPTGGTGTSTSQTASSSFKTDYGLVASLAVKIPLNMAVSFLIDGRYYYGVSNASKIAGETLKFRDAQALFGLNFEF